MILRKTSSLRRSLPANDLNSEKVRIPAWCDRVLRKGDILRQTSYATAPLKFSDHRPVLATFECTVTIVDEVKKQHLSQNAYARRRQDVGDVVTQTVNGDDDEDLIGYDSIAPELPPASSDRRKWWLDNGKEKTEIYSIDAQFLIRWVALPARATIPPVVDKTVNPERPSNPFASTSQPDFIQTPSQIYRTQDKAPTAINPAVSRPQSRAEYPSVVTRKPAPAVPQKPNSLNKPGERLTSSLKGSTSKSRLSPPTLASENGDEQYGKSDVDISQRHAEPRQSARSEGRINDADGPPLPPRRSNKPASVAGLMDQDEEPASLIPPLQPRR